MILASLEQLFDYTKKDYSKLHVKADEIRAQEAGPARQLAVAIASDLLKLYEEDVDFGELKGFSTNHPIIDRIYFRPIDEIVCVGYGPSQQHSVISAYIPSTNKEKSIFLVFDETELRQQHENDRHLALRLTVGGIPYVETLRPIFTPEGYINPDIIREMPEPRQNTYEHFVYETTEYPTTETLMTFLQAVADALSQYLRPTPVPESQVASARARVENPFDTASFRASKKKLGEMITSLREGSDPTPNIEEINAAFRQHLGTIENTYKKHITLAEQLQAALRQEVSKLDELRLQLKQVKNTNDP